MLYSWGPHLMKVVTWGVLGEDGSRAVVDLFFDLLQSIRSNPGKVDPFGRYCLTSPL
ncbi:hypothetical protein N8665_03725 [Akkermansiaceae bacterium]|nr:hypothetical protein [Akkermansiaceae bacterium]